MPDTSSTPTGVKWYVHVNQHKIRKNIHAPPEEIDHPVAVRRGRSGVVSYGSTVKLPPNSVIRYSPHEPLLACGARLVIECEEKPEIVS